MRYDFASDNAAGMAPAAFAALSQANAGFAPAYGRDETSLRAADLIRARLDVDAEVRFVPSGTAANALSLAMLARPHEAVLAYQGAHVCTSESGAPGFFGSGLGLIGLPGLSGKIDPLALEASLLEPEEAGRQPAAALSITQVTEYGGVYDEDELRVLIAPAREKGLRIHVDGARLANAAAAGFDLRVLGRLGVDVLVFGGAKAGAAAVEALVVLDKALARRLDNRLKQAGQTASKGRFLAAPLLGLLDSGEWEAGAAHANGMAQALAALIAERSPFVLAHPVEANMVFVRMSGSAHERLTAAGWACSLCDDGSVRFVCSWATTPEAVEALAAQLAGMSADFL